MIPVCDDDPGIVLIQCYQDRFGGIQWEYLPPVYHSPDLQKTEQYLVPALDYYVKNGCDRINRVILMP